MTRNDRFPACGSDPSLQVHHYGRGRTRLVRPMPWTVLLGVALVLGGICLVLGLMARPPRPTP